VWHTPGREERTDDAYTFYVLSLDVRKLVHPHSELDYDLYCCCEYSVGMSTVLAWTHRHAAAVTSIMSPGFRLSRGALRDLGTVARRTRIDTTSCRPRVDCS
jgi:hypothetical protein